MLSELKKRFVDFFMIPETTLNDSFPEGQLFIDGYIHLSGMTEMVVVVALFFPSARTFQQKLSIVIFQVSKVFLLKWIFLRKRDQKNSSCKPHKKHYRQSSEVITKTLDTYYGKYESVAFLGDSNAVIEETTMKSFCESYNLTNFIKQPTCFKNPQETQLWWLNTNQQA